MNEEELQSMQGQIQALGMVMTNLLPSLGPVEAAQAAVGLAIALEEAKIEDLNGETPPAQAFARNGIAQAYLDLLSAISKSP